MAVLLLVAIIVVGVVAGTFVIARSRRSADGVDSFRRQIDALSPEARRTVVDQVQHAAGEGTGDSDSADDADDDEDGARGT